MSGGRQTRTTWALPQSLRNAQTVSYIPDVDSAARGANLLALQGSLVRTDLWHEAALLSKLLYKSKNQHRSSKHFQYLSEVKRCMRLLQQVQLSDLVGDLNHLRSNAGVGMPATASLVMFGRASKLQVPSQQAGILVLQRLLAGGRLAVKTIPAAHAAAAQLLAQLSMTYFMPFCLTALAMLARIQVLVCQLLLDSIKAYNCLMPLVIVLPQQSLAGTGTYPDLPHMLSCSWTAGVPTLSLIPHTDFPSFAAAAQAFHTTHYSSNVTQLASSSAQEFGRKIGRGAETTAAASGNDIGEKVGRATAKPVAGAAEDIGEKVSRAKVTPAAGTVGDVGEKVNRIAVASTAGSGGDTGKMINGVAVAKGNDLNVSETAGRAAGLAGSRSNTDAKGARASSGSSLGQEVTRPSSTKLKTAVSDCSVAEALGSMPAQSVAAAASLVPKAQSSMDKLWEAKHHASDSHDFIPPKSHVMPVGLAAKPARRQGAQASQAEQLASPGDAALLVFEDKQTEAGGADESQALRYRHTLPSVMLGSQAGRVAQTDEASSTLHSRLHRQSDRAGSTRKRSREELSRDSGPDPQRRPQSTSTLSQPLRPPQKGYQHSSQSQHWISESLAATSHRPMAPAGQANQQSSAQTSSSDVLAGSRSPTGKAPLCKIFRLGQKAANQPAFIRIGGNEPRTVRNAIQPAVAGVPAQGKALLQPAVAHAAALREVSCTASPAAAAADPLALPAAGPTALPAAGPTALPAAGSSAPQAAGPNAAPAAGPNAAPAAGPNAAPAALPATSGAMAAALPAADLTSGSAANRPPSMQQGGQTGGMPGTAPEGRDTVYAAAETSTAGALASSSSNSRAYDSLPLLSKATDQRAAAQAAMSRSQNGDAAVTAAPHVPRRTQENYVTQGAMPILFAASAAPVLVEAAEMSLLKAVNLATVSTAVVESSAATATPPADRGDVTPEPAVMQNPVGQQMLLPTSRRKRKGQKAAKVAELARNNSNWQELVELSGAAEPAAALSGKATSGLVLEGHNPAVSKGDQDQYPANTPVQQASTSMPPNTQEIMKMLLGTK
ncbi:hypothetical protein WJX77_011348 [Trebouxia sp. C0004]